MFTLSGLILETRENLFRDFWSTFSISFYFSSEWNYLKKTRNRLCAVLGQDTAGRGLYKPPPRGPKAQPPQPRNPNPSRAQPPPPPIRRSSAPPEVRRLDFHAVKRRFRSSSFFFVGFFRGYFLIAISDPIFVLV